MLSKRDFTRFLVTQSVSSCTLTLKESVKLDHWKGVPNATWFLQKCRQRCRQWSDLPKPRQWRWWVKEMLHVPTCFKSSCPLPFGCLSLYQTSMKVKNTFLQRACHMYSSGMFWSKGSSRPKSSGSGCNIHESPTLKHQCGPYPHPEIPRPETFAPALSKSCICRVTFVQMKMCGSKSCSFPTNAAH